MTRIITINPSTEEIITEYALHDENRILNIINQNDAAYHHWSSLSLDQRSQLFIRLADLLKNKTTTYANLITTEMGKPITASEAEIKKSALVCMHYATEAETYLQPKTIPSSYSKSFVLYQPLGTILAIMPWNYPFWQVFRFAAPTMMAGNVILLKHAPNVTGCALMIEDLFRQAGFPENVFRTLITDNATTQKVIQHASIAGVSLTGSEHAGRAVARAAGKKLKKVILELGGNDPYLILEDADIEQAAKICLASRLNNAGQVCIAAKRIIVVDAVYEQFESLVLQFIKAYQPGDPQHPMTTLGPLARADLRATLAQQVAASIKMGANCLYGGTIPDRKGFYYNPTVLSQLTTNTPAFQDELFGPVVALFGVKDTEAGIVLANQSRFGLGGAVFTRDREQGLRIATQKLNVGFCAVNNLVSSDPALPFGGIKNSGVGRELGAEGIRAFTNIKTITVD